METLTSGAQAPLLFCPAPGGQMRTARGTARHLLVCFLASCTGLGNSGTDVRIRNATTEAVTVTEVGQGPGGHDLVSRVGAAEERVSLWHFTNLPFGIGGGSKITVRATSETDQPLFCHSFSFDDLRSSQGLVSIKGGQLDCR